MKNIIRMLEILAHMPTETVDLRVCPVLGGYRVMFVGADDGLAVTLMNDWSRFLMADAETVPEAFAALDAICAADLAASSLKP